MVLLRKKGKRRKKKKKTESQPIIVCTKLKIVINRACLKKNKKQLLPFFLYKREFMTKNLAVRNVICVYISEYGTN